MEGTPFRWRLPVEQQTSPAGPQTPPGDNMAPSRDQLRATPLNMFQESSPSTQQQQAASSGTDRSPWRTARVVTELPAIPTRPNQSYGTTGTVTLPKMNINDSGFHRFGSSLQGLTNVSADAFKSRRSGRQQQPDPDHAAEIQAKRRQPRRTPYSLPKPGLGEAPLDYLDQQGYLDQQDYADQQVQEDPDIAEAASLRQRSRSRARSRQGQGGARLRQATQGGVRTKQRSPRNGERKRQAQGATEQANRATEQANRATEQANRATEQANHASPTVRYDPSNWGHIRGFFRANWNLVVWDYLPRIFEWLVFLTAISLFFVYLFIPFWNHLDPVERFKGSYPPISVIPINRPFKHESRPPIPWEDKSGGPITTVDKPWPVTAPEIMTPPQATSGDKSRPKEATDDEIRSEKTAGDKSRPKKTTDDETRPEKTAGDKSRPEKTTDDEIRPEKTAGDKSRPEKATNDETRPEKISGPTDDSQTYDILSLERRVTALEIGLERALREKSQDLQKWNDNFRALAKNFEKAKASTDRRLTEFEKLEIGRKLNQIGDKLENAVKDIAELKQFRQTTDAAFAQLYKDLPKKLPVRYNDKGKVEVMPEFWQDLTRWLKEQRYSKGISKGSGGGTETVIIEKPAKWEDFLARNGKQLDAHIGNLQEKWHQRALREQTLIPKEHHLELVKDLRDEYLKGVEEQFKEVHHELGAQLSSITNLRSMIESGEFGKGTGAGKPIGKFLADGLYSHHISKLADYASLTGGGFIDPDRTSETYSKHPPNTFVNWAHWALGTPNRIPKPGRVISMDARRAGNCWPFAGKKGNLGIILREPVYVTGITLEHMEWEKCLFRDSAPKLITFWVKIMEIEKYYKKAVLEAAKALGERPGLVQAGKKSKAMYEYVKVGVFEYEFTPNSSPEQTFWIPMDMRRLNISSDRVLMHVYDNYGNPNYTCIYRLRVHGEPLGLIENMSKAEGMPTDVVEGEDTVPWGDLGDYPEL